MWLLLENDSSQSRIPGHRDNQYGKLTSTCKAITDTFERIRLATYNVNDKLPPPGTTELAPLVGQGEEDLLVFGLQEMGASSLYHFVGQQLKRADLRSSALLISQGKGRADEWEAALLRGLGSKADEYEKVRPCGA